MARLMPCPSHLSPLPVDWFDTGRDPIGTFRFRGGREAPTTCGMILDLPGGRRFIPARPPGFAAAPWATESRFEWLADLAWSARRALIGQTPRGMALMLVTLDLPRHRAGLQAVFDYPPAADDEEQIALVEAEVTADFAGCCTVHTELLLSAPGDGPQVSGTVAYRRDD